MSETASSITAIGNEPLRMFGLTAREISSKFCWQAFKKLKNNNEETDGKIITIYKSVMEDDLGTGFQTSNKSVDILSEEEQVYEATDGLTGLTLNRNNKVEEFNKLNEVFSNRVNRRVYNKRIINGQGEREEVIASK
ncbi:22209_t:CDS:2 [Rhizophagus irregularis]|nr:22209_t:CDS:2 [Rhizophagus irregularis]